MIFILGKRSYIRARMAFVNYMAAMRTSTDVHANGKAPVASAVDLTLRDLADKIRTGEIKLRDVEKFVEGDSNEAAAVRRMYLEQQAQVATEHIGRHSIDLTKSHGATSANEIGAVQITLTHPGEISVNGTYASGAYPIILAKEEGMLTEGIGRGIGVVNAAGGVTTVVTKDGMARDIMVSVSGIVEGKKLMDWIGSAEGAQFLRAQFNRNVGNHGGFESVETFPIGKDVHIRFVGSTGAANGMNKVTIAASRTVSAMILRVNEELGMSASLASESGNVCVDKKPAAINSIRGRGVSVLAEITIPREIVAEKFKGLTPSDIVDLNNRKNLVGSAIAGSMGFNAHVANILGGIYTATGQDVAHIISGSQSITLMQMDNNGDLYVTLKMPAVEVATYGGATKNPTHSEVLKLMGLYGEGDEVGHTRLAFAEVVAAACLAGELNLIAVQAQKELALSHSTLRRD